MPKAVGSRLKAIAWPHSRRSSPSVFALAGTLSAQTIAINPAISGLTQRASEEPEAGGSFGDAIRSVGRLVAWRARYHLKGLVRLFGHFTALDESG